MDRRSPWFPWESAIHQPEVRFDIRAERAEYEGLFRQKARVLQACRCVSQVHASAQCVQDTSCLAGKMGA